MRQFFQKNNKSPFRIIIVGFSLAIFMGSLLLMLPISSQQGVRTPFLDALYRASFNYPDCSLSVYRCRCISHRILF